MRSLKFKGATTNLFKQEDPNNLNNRIKKCGRRQCQSMDLS